MNRTRQGSHRQTQVPFRFGVHHGVMMCDHRDAIYIPWCRMFCFNKQKKSFSIMHKILESSFAYGNSIVSCTSDFVQRVDLMSSVLTTKK